MKKFICICLAAIIAISGIVGYFIWKNNQEPEYLPLDYMYAINLDTGGKVTPGMSREEVEKVFPQPQNGDVIINEISEDNGTYYYYCGIGFFYNYNDILATLAIGPNTENEDWFKCEVAGMQYTDLEDKTYKDIVEIYGKPTLKWGGGFPYSLFNIYDITYVCYIEDGRLRVITPSEYAKFESIEKSRVEIEFKLTDERKVSCVKVLNWDYID